MRRLWRIAGLFWLAASPIDSGAAQSGKLPPGSFVRRPVHSTRQLLRHVQSDTLVLRRYENHFRLGRRGIVQMLGSAAPKRLTEDHYVRVYYVHPGEQYGSRARRLRRGTPAFVLPDGTPLLILACGNPITRYRPRPNQSVGLPPELFIPDYSATEPVEEVRPEYVERPAETPDLIASAIPLFAPPPAGAGGGETGEAPPSTALPPGASVEIAPQYAPDSYPEPPPFSMGPPAPNALLLAPLIGSLVFIALPHGGPGGGGSHLPPPSRVPTPPAAVVVAIGALVWWVGLRRRRVTPRMPRCQTIS